MMRSSASLTAGAARCRLSALARSSYRLLLFRRARRSSRLSTRGAAPPFDCPPSSLHRRPTLPHRPTLGCKPRPSGTIGSASSACKLRLRFSYSTAAPPPPRPLPPRPPMPRHLCGRLRRLAACVCASVMRRASDGSSCPKLCSCRRALSVCHRAGTWCTWATRSLVIARSRSFTWRWTCLLWLTRSSSSATAPPCYVPPSSTRGPPLALV